MRKNVRSGRRESFLPDRVARAADEAASEVLLEDLLLRRYGIQPENGRAR